METLVRDSHTPPAPAAVWRLLRGEVESLVDDVNDTLARHLRERPLVLADGAGFAATLAVGGLRLRFDLDRDDDPPALFGSAERVLRLTARDGRAIVALLWIEPTTLRWTSTETTGELFRLDDRRALERFLLPLFCA